jgi:DNA invertase Pin-like site-specific DNA recombinase
MIICYLRVSTDSQSLDAQREAVAHLADRIFEEKESGARTDRPELAKAIAFLQPGDTLTVTRIDRLARSTLDLLTIIDRVAKAGATFKSLADAWCDTTTPHGKLMLTVLGGLAEFERSLIATRTGEGRRRAMARGVRFGPRPKLSPIQIAEARRQLDAGASYTAVAELFGVSRQTIMRAECSDRV